MVYNLLNKFVKQFDSFGKSCKNMELCQVCHQTEQHINSKQCNSLEIVFLLQIVLEMPEPKLIEILKEVNNKWINICGRCTQLLEQCRGISLELGEIFRRFRESKLELVNILRQREQMEVEEQEQFLEECWSFAKRNDYEEWNEPLFKVLCGSETLVVEIQNEEGIVKEEAEIAGEEVWIGPEADEDEVEGLTKVNPDQLIQPQAEIRLEYLHQDPLAIAVEGPSRKRKSTALDDDEDWNEDTEDESSEEEVDEDDDEEYDPKEDSNTKRKAKKLKRSFKINGKPSEVQNIKSKRSCNICKGEFANKYQLQNHIAEFHDKSKTFICHECEKEFPFKNFLQHHLDVIHRPWKAFQCNKCSFEATRPATALAHMLEAHSKSNVKMNGISCPFEKCSVVVIDFQKLGQHLRKNHSRISVEQTLREMFGLYKKLRTI